jgi:hypothetical protein
MENHRGSGLLGKNIFAEAFQQFDEEEFFDNLHHKVKNKPYYERYLGFKNTVNLLSHIFSIASAITSGYTVYWLAVWAGAAIWLSLVIGGVILIFLERVKRKASEETWQVFFFEGKLPMGWVLFSALLFAQGVFTSSFGAKQGAQDLAPAAHLITSDSTAGFYRQRIAALEAENQKLAGQKNQQGQIFWPAQRQMARNKESITKYEARALALEEKLEGKNDGLQADHDKNVAFSSRVFMLVQICMELIFEGCIAYIWYFYYRVYVERKKLKGIPGGSPSSAPPSGGSNHSRNIDPDLVAQLVAAAMERMQPAPEPPSSNGQRHESPLRTPIGFYTDAQRARQRWPEAPEPLQEVDRSVQACTEMYTPEEIVTHDDFYTVLHEYSRGGKNYLTPYTENQILARIGQYERNLEEAGQKGMTEDILENRSRWLAYWQGKLEELYGKQEKAGIR